jgi:hypothetical protein
VQPSLWQPLAGSSSHHDQQLAPSHVEQRAENLAGGCIEPVHILRHQQSGPAGQTRQQIGLHRPRDQLVESSTLGSHLLVAGLRFDTEYRRQQRHSALRVQPAGANLAVQQPQPLGLTSVAVDAAATLQQRAYGVQAGVGVER